MPVCAQKRHVSLQMLTRCTHCVSRAGQLPSTKQEFTFRKMVTVVSVPNLKNE